MMKNAFAWPLLCAVTAVLGAEQLGLTEETPLAVAYGGSWVAVVVGGCLYGMWGWYRRWTSGRAWVRVFWLTPYLFMLMVLGAAFGVFAASWILGEICGLADSPNSNEARRSLCGIPRSTIRLGW